MDNGRIIRDLREVGETQAIIKPWSYTLNKTSSGEKRTATRRSSSLQGKGIGEIKGRLFKRNLT